MTAVQNATRNLKHCCINTRNGSYMETYKLFKMFVECLDRKHTPIELEGFLYKASSIVTGGNVQNCNAIFRKWLKSHGWERVEND